MSKVLDVLNKLCSQTPSKWYLKAKYRQEHRRELKDLQCMVLKILDRMDDMHYTAEHLSNDVGYSLDVVRELLRGKTKFTDEQIKSFEEVLG